MKGSKYKDLKTRNLEVSKVIKDVQSLDLFQTSGRKKGIKVIDQNLKRLGRTDTDLLYLKGGLLEVLEKFQESAAVYQDILCLIPNHLGATMDLGDVYYDLGEFRKALMYQNRALKLIKTKSGYKGRFSFAGKGEYFIQAVRGKSEALLALKRPKEALKCIVNALQSYPADIALRSCLEDAQEQFHNMKLPTIKHSKLKRKRNAKGT